MAYLSIRNLPARLEKRIVAEARRRHTTKTAIVIEYLEKAIASKGQEPGLPARREDEAPTFSEKWAGKFRLTKRDDLRTRRLKSKYEL